MPAEEPGEPQALRAGQQFTPEERKAVSIAKKKSLETARKYPEARRLEIQTDRNGNPKFEQVLDAEGNPVLDAKGRPIMEVAFAKLPYDLLGSPKLSKNRDRAVMQTADLLEGDARKAFNDPAISKGIGWYSRMRDFLQQQFGASIEVFGQLLGATSARTPVDTNFRQALEALKLLSTGQYDGLLADFSQYANKVYSDAKSGELLRQWQEKNPGKKPSAFKVEDEIRKQINKFESVPLRANGKKYNANSQKVLHVLYGLWLDQTVGPKTPNFAGNLTGRTLKATIDVWAARNLRRLLYEGAREKWRLLPEQETGVTDPDFFFAQDAYDVVAKRLGMNADDLQALMWFMEKDVWEKNGWTSTVGAEKSSFDKEAGKLALDRFQAGVTTFTDLSKFKSDIQEKERLALRKSISGLEGLVAARVNNSSGLYGGVFEPSFDIEFSVSKNPDGTTKNISNQISEIIRVASQPGRVQSDVFVSQIVPPNHPNARPIMEVGFKKGASWDDISEAVAAFQDNGIDGFTLARDDRGNVIGIRAQYIPEFSAVYESMDHLDPQIVDSKMQDWVSRANAASVALDRIDNVSYKKNGTVSTIVYGLEEYSTARPIEPESSSLAAELGRRRAIAEQRRQVSGGADAGQAVEPGAGGLPAPAGDVQPAGVSPQGEVGAQRYMPSDTAYLSAVQKGDTQAAQRMVDEAAKAAGINRKVDPETVRTFWRVGKPPKGGRSYNTKDNFFEKGVSTYFYPEATSFAGAGRNDWYKVEGTFVGYGSDGEPLVKVDSFKKGTPQQIEDALKNRPTLQLFPGDSFRFPKYEDYASEFTVRSQKRRADGTLYGYEIAPKSISKDYPIGSQIPYYRKLGPEFLANDETGVTDITYAPITRDDAGNVIPLSKRFQQTSEDIRYMPSDDEYLTAVKRGNTSAAQDMVDAAAKAAGYTVGPVYHGTPTGGFNVFDKRMRGETSGVSRQAFSFTTNQKAAENYSKRLGDEAVRLDAGLRVANDAMRRFDDDVAAQEYFSSKGYTSVEDGMLPEFDWGAIEDVPEFIKELRGYAKDLKPINPDLASSFIDAAKVMSSTKAVPEVKRVFLRIPENAPVFQATPSTLGMVMRDFSAEREPTKAGIVELPGNERIYYVADSSQVKLADPVTKDAQGNVIPLSKRFQASSEDIRFMPSEYLTRGPDGRVYVQPSVKTEDLSGAKGAVKGQERGVKAHGAYSQITGQVSIDRNAIKSLTKEQRASLIRHEMAHKLETESGLWDKSETALWDLWTRDKNHPIWDFMAETTGRSKFGGAEAAEIIANLYADHYPKGTFTVKERPYPYQNEPDVPGPYEYAIPTQIKEVLDSIDNKLGIWKKKKARKNISDTNPTPQVEAGSQRFMPDYSGEHRAPRRDSGAPLDNLKGVYPDDVYGPNAARYYGHESGSQTDKAAVRIIQATKGKPDAPVKVFRAIPKSIQSNEINPGDWITTIKSYAVQHGEGPLGGDYKILEKTVPAGDLYTNGDSIFEFGYDPKFMPQPDSAMPGAYSFPGGYRALPGKAKGSLRLYGPAGSLIGIAASLDEAQRIIRRKTRQ